MRADTIRTSAKIAGLLLLAELFAAPAAIMAQGPARVPDVNLREVTRPKHQERHPTMRRSIAQLEQTRAMLQNDSAHDFHGHRDAAIHHIDAAIHELREGVESDRGGGQGRDHD